MARTPVTHSNLERRMAHDRQPPPEYLKQQGVNLTIFPPASSADAALNVADYAVKFGPDLWMPFNTLNAQWATARFADRELKARKDFLDQRACPQPLSCRRTTPMLASAFSHISSNGFDGWQPWRVRRSATSTSICKLRGAQQLIWGPRRLRFSDQLPPQPRETGRQARARSPAFTATADQFLAFLIAGDAC